VGVNNVTELMSNQSMNMTNLTSLTTNQGANLTSLVVMVPRVCPTALRKSHWYTRYYILMANFLVMALVPFSLLVGLNFKLYRTVQESGKIRNDQKKRSREKREQKIASLLILLVIVFGCCNVVKIIINLYEVFLVAVYGNYKKWPLWCDILTYLSHLLLVINSSMNIVIYCWKDKKFRRALIQLLTSEQVSQSLSTFSRHQASSPQNHLLHPQRRRRSSREEEDLRDEISSIMMTEVQPTYAATTTV